MRFLVLLIFFFLVKPNEIKASTNNEVFIEFIKNEPKNSSDLNNATTYNLPKIESIYKIINLLGIALIFILSLLSISLYRNNTLEVNANTLLKEKNAELEQERLKSAEAVQQKNEFLATITHELKTPLHSINILTQLLLDENPKKSQIENLVSLKISSNYLMNLINDLLEINKIESNISKIEKKEFNLQNLFKNIQKALHEIGKQNHVICEYYIDENIPKIIIGDHLKLSQILINLISNAIKFSPNGHVKISILLKEDLESCIKLHFTVADTGIGIRKEYLDNIFDDFKQGSPEINKKFGGTGLGLSIVKKLIELQGSEIHVESKPKMGSTFYFTLTYDKVNHYSESFQNELQQIKNKEILIVEDNTINQVLTKKLITKYGANCTTVANGYKALELTKKKNYDLIIMDINLPDINGDSVTQEIRKFNKTVPIIAYTAISGQKCIDHLLSCGLNDVIAKPIHTKNFYEKILKNLS